MTNPFKLSNQELGYFIYLFLRWFVPAAALCYVAGETARKIFEDINQRTDRMLVLFGVMPHRPQTL